MLAPGSRLPAPVSVITVEPRIWYNPQLRSTLFLVPGLIAYISMITAVVSTALSVVREKERGTMEQVRMAPLSPLPYILGKTFPYLVISFMSAILVILAAMLLFELPMHGSWGLLCLSIALFLVGAQAQGLLISTIAQSQQVAFQIALLSSLLPTMILSGFIFPISSMPTGGAVDHPYRTGALFPGGAAGDRVEGGGHHGLLATADGTCHLRDRRDDAGISTTATGMVMSRGRHRRRRT